jgi:hypothetical protein
MSSSAPVVTFSSPKITFSAALPPKYIAKNFDISFFDI